MAKPLTDYTVEELQAKAKLFKTIFAIAIVLVIVMACCLIYLMIQGTRVSPAMIAAGVAIFGGLIPSISGLSAVKKELATRKSD